MDEKETLQICRGIAGPSYITCNNGVYLVNRKQPSRIGKWFRKGVAGALIAASALSMPAVTYADEKPKVVQNEPLRKLELKGIEEYVRKNLDVIVPGDKEWERTRQVKSVDEKPLGKWSFSIGECTYWSGLASEKPLVSIEKLTGMNIRTFTDIRDDNYLSDMFVIVSRDLNDKLAVYGAIGGAMTTIKNRKDNGLSIDISREELYGALGLTWHPLGRPTEVGLRGAKPIIDLEAGVTYSGAGVDFGLFGRNIFKENNHDIFAYINPRIGIETLLMKRNPDRKVIPSSEVSFIMEVGVLKPSMKDVEYGGANAAMYTRFRW